MNWDDPGSIALVICDGGGNWDFVDGFKDNLVYDQSNDGVDDYGDYY